MDKITQEACFRQRVLKYAAEHIEICGRAWSDGISKPAQAKPKDRIQMEKAV